MLATKNSIFEKSDTGTQLHAFMLTSLEQAGFGAAISNRNGILESSNGKFARFLGWSNAKLAGIAIGDLFHPDDSDLIGKWIKPVVTKRTKLSKVEHPLLNKQGKSIFARLTISEQLLNGEPSLLILLEKICCGAPR